MRQEIINLAEIISKRDEVSLEAAKVTIKDAVKAVEEALADSSNLLDGAEEVWTDYTGLEMDYLLDILI